MAATANKIGLSKTDLPNSWIAKPKKASRNEAIRIAEHFLGSDNKGSITASSMGAGGGGAGWGGGGEVLYVKVVTF